MIGHQNIGQQAKLFLNFVRKYSLTKADLYGEMQTEPL